MEAAIPLHRQPYILQKDCHATNVENTGISSGSGQYGRKDRPGVGWGVQNRPAVLLTNYRGWMIQGRVTE
jgi:hypothetical protein